MRSVKSPFNIRWIHVGCDPLLDQARYDEMVEYGNQKFTCILCEPKRRDRHMGTLVAAERKYTLVEYHEQPLYAPPLHKRIST